VLRRGAAAVVVGGSAGELVEPLRRLGAEVEVVRRDALCG